MFFSWYFISLIILFSLISLLFPIGWYIFYAVLLVFSVWLIDLIQTIKQPKIIAKRIFEDPFYNNLGVEVKLILVNPINHPLRIFFKDEPPLTMIGENYSGRLFIPADSGVTVIYKLKPLKRGLFVFGDLNIRLIGRLGLFSYQFKIKIKQSVRVYPDLNKINTQRLSRLVGSNAEGLLRQKIIGVGGEMAQVREYVRGDDYRKVNWKVTAHRGKPYVNEYEPEKDQNVFLLFDTGRLLYDQINQTYSRFDHILDSAILLAYNIQEHGDLVGALSFNCRMERFIPAGKGNHHLELLLSQLYNLEAFMVESDYREAFNFWQGKVKKRSLIFIYTDLLDTESSKDLINYLRILNRHHLVVCVLYRQNSLEAIAATPITDERSAYLKGTVFELLKERRALIRSLVGYGIKILEVNPSTIRSEVVRHYEYLKNKGMF